MENSAEGGNGRLFLGISWLGRLPALLSYNIFQIGRSNLLTTLAHGLILPVKTLNIDWLKKYVMWTKKSVLSMYVIHGISQIRNVDVDPGEIIHLERITITKKKKKKGKKRNEKLVFNMYIQYQKANLFRRRLSLLLLQLSRQFRHYVEQIPNETHVGDLKNGRIGVLVDGRDDFTILHARQMLNRAGNAGAEIQLRRDIFARLTYLQTIVREAAVNSCPRGANGSAQRIGQRWDEVVKLLLRFQTSTA